MPIEGWITLKQYLGTYFGPVRNSPFCPKNSRALRIFKIVSLVWRLYTNQWHTFIKHMKQWKLSRDEWMAVYDNFKTKVSMWLSVSCDITLLWNGELKGLSIYEKEENREHRKSLETHEKCYKSLERVKKAWNSFEWEHRKSLETH